MRNPHLFLAFVSALVAAGCSGGGSGYRHDGFIPFGDGSSGPDMKRDFGSSSPDFATPPPDFATQVDFATKVDFTVAPSCFDGIQNGQETDVDCGGPTCSPCANGFMCKGANDCSSSRCSNALCCDTAHANCDFNAGNGCEVSILTDNFNCGACGKACAQGTTCTNGACVAMANKCSQDACTHSPCAASLNGAGPLKSGCDAKGCVAAVCTADSFCCMTDWDATCVSEVAQYCTCGC